MEKDLSLQKSNILQGQNVPTASIQGNRSQSLRQRSETLEGCAMTFSSEGARLFQGDSFKGKTIHVEIRVLENL